MTSENCRICGRVLTNPVSIKREIGPVCWTRLPKKNDPEEAETSG